MRFLYESVAVSGERGAAVLPQVPFVIGGDPEKTALHVHFCFSRVVEIPAHTVIFCRTHRHRITEDMTPKNSKFKEKKKMRKTRTKKILSLILLLVLSAAIALSAFGCDDKKDDGSAVTTTTAPVDDTNVRGEGATSFTFTVSQSYSIFEVNNGSYLVYTIIHSGPKAGRSSTYFW